MKCEFCRKSSMWHNVEYVDNAYNNHFQNMFEHIKKTIKTNPNGNIYLLKTVICQLKFWEKRSFLFSSKKGKEMIQYIHANIENSVNS